MSKPSIALGNLRGVVIVIVLAFHSSLAYLASTPAPTARFDQPPYQWQAFPIVDSQRWLGLDIFCSWQDVSLMAIMFLLSGLFVAGSLERKGGWVYLSDRVWRIGVPFLLAVVFLSLPSFYPAYLLRTANPSLADFWQQWLSLPSWPCGPQWFLWQLFVVNALGAALYLIAPASFDRLGRAAAWAGDHPVKFYVSISVLTILVYAPLTLAFSPWQWSAFGPFSLQLCRPGVYIVFFTVGLALGHHGIARGLLASNGPLARFWWAWFALALITWAVWAGLTSLTFPDWDKASLAARIGASLAFPPACLAGGLFLLALCLRFAAELRLRALDSLSANAYSIYMVHYVFVVWLQYALLGDFLPALGKVAIVFAGAMGMSWAVSVAFHTAIGPRVGAVKRATSPASR